MGGGGSFARGKHAEGARLVALHQPRLAVQDGTGAIGPVGAVGSAGPTGPTGPRGEPVAPVELVCAACGQAYPCPTRRHGLHLFRRFAPWVPETTIGAAHPDGAGS